MTFHHPVDAAADLADVAQDLAGLSTAADVSVRVTQLAAKLLACKASDLVRVDTAGSIRVLASSDPGLSRLTEDAWNAWPHQPVPTGPDARSTTTHRDHAGYRQQLHRSTGVGAELMVPLTAGSIDHGHLRFLFAEPVVDAAVRLLIAAYAVHAALALDRVGLAVTVGNLHLALAGNRTIGAAAGILMALQNLTYDQALDRLKTTSQQRNRKLRDIAADVVYTGEIGGQNTAGVAPVVTPV